MNNPHAKHKIEIYLTWEQYERLAEAAHYVGCGDDLERYIISILADL
jgi:hypothetical protein